MNDEVRFKNAKQFDGATTLPATREALDDIFDDQEPDAFMRIKAFCESGDASDMLGIYRAMPNRKEQFICKIDVSEFDPEYIKGRFGGGDFIIKAYDGRSRLRLNQRLSIEGEPIIERVPQMGAVAQQSGAQLDTAALLSIMQENNRQMLAGIAQMLQQSQPLQHSRADMLQEMLTMKELFSSGTQQAPDSTVMLLKGIELAKSLTPIEGGTSSGMDVLMETVKNFGKPIAQMMAQQQRPPVPQQNRIAHSAPPIPSIPRQPEETEQMNMMSYYLGILCANAAAGKDPVLYADLVADTLNDQQATQLMALPDIVGHFGAINPKVLEHRVWFDALVSELKIIYGLTPDIGDDTVSSNNPTLTDAKLSDDKPAT